MITDSSFQFIKEKIIEVGSAILYNEADDIFKLPTSLIIIRHIDDEGHIWVGMNKPSQSLDAFEKEFPVRLEFFKKGKDYNLEVMGNAFIPDSEEIMLSNLSTLKNQILVKVKIINAKYFARHPEKLSLDFKAWLRKIYSWFFITNDGYQVYSFDDKMQVA